MRRPTNEELVNEVALLRGQLAEAEAALKYVRAAYTTASAEWIDTFRQLRSAA
ncbi:hypothetical protein M2272_005904 [Mycobacterium frederiksbergense]|uniref:Uncharacterized protein n=1 Tax=Mycolicibacterium frederiksbergense TaxID=117567 RepID=A0ABT6L8F5_9MYCO|nr:hypothetical protein [Mycolicibacterium frederiksbergense]